MTELRHMPPHTALRVLDLFSGIGGFSLGLERAGMRTVQFVEIDPYCRAVLRKHWPEVPIHDDIQTFDARGFGADVVCGGFPCQPVSLAGKRRGSTDERWLWPEYARIVGELRPRFVIVENVPGLLNLGMGRVLGDLSALGYDCEWHVISAASVGAPHRRERVWIVAYAEGRPTGAGNDLRAGQPDARDGCQTLAHHFGAGLEIRPRLAGYLAEELAALERGRQVVADAAWVQPGRSQQWAERQRVGAGGQPEPVPHPDSEPSRRLAEPRGECGQWLVEPDVGRVANGVPARVDRLRALGNAVVPQIPEIIGRAIMRAAA